MEIEHLGLPFVFSAIARGAIGGDGYPVTIRIGYWCKIQSKHRLCYKINKKLVLNFAICQSKRDWTLVILVLRSYSLS